jgi:hypothetical protein
VGRSYALSGLVWLVSLVLSASHVQAQMPPAGASDRDPQARLLFEQGREAYSDGRYRDAWAYFHEAYQLSGRPELLFNIGQTADRLGQENDAVKAFTMYLERLPAAPNRRDVENRVRALRERLAAVQHASTPAPTAAAPVRPAPPPQPAVSVRPVPQQAPVPAPAPVAAKTPKLREPRRGFYLRGSIGAGYRADGLTRTTSSGLFDQTSVDYTIDGLGLALDLGIGWGVLPGFAVGGAMFLDWTNSPTLATGSTSSSLSSANLTTIGPFVDWYPIRKTLGWHILGGFGLAVYRYKNEASNNAGIDGTAVGASFLLGTGYEFNLSTSFALGIELRFVGAVLGEAVDSQSTSHGILSPSVLASFTWF